MAEFTTGDKLFVIKCENTTFKIYGQPYTIFSRSSIINTSLDLPSFINARYITISAESLPFVPRPFLWIWRYFNNVKQESKGWKRDEVIMLWKYMRYYNIPRAKDRDWIRIFFLAAKTKRDLKQIMSIQAIALDLQLRNPRIKKVSDNRLDIWIDLFHQKYMLLFSPRERPSIVPPAILTKELYRLIPATPESVTVFVPIAETYKGSVVQGKDLFIHVVIPYSKVCFSIIRLDKDNKGVTHTPGRASITSSLSYEKNEWRYNKKIIIPYVSYFFAPQDYIEKLVNTEQKEIVPYDNSGVIRQIYNTYDRSSPQFLVGSESLPMLASPLIMKLRSHYFKGIDFAEMGTHIAREYKINDGFYLVWSHLMGFHINLPKMGWIILHQAWAFICYFGIPLSSRFVRQYMSLLFESAVVEHVDIDEARKRLRFLHSIIDVGKATIPVSIRDKLSIIASTGKGESCLIDQAFSLLSGNTVRDKLYTKKYAQYVPSPDRGRAVVIWNIKYDSGTTVIAKFPYIIKSGVRSVLRQGKYTTNALLSLTHPLVKILSLAPSSDRHYNIEQVGNEYILKQRDTFYRFTLSFFNPPQQVPLTLAECRRE